MSDHGTFHWNELHTTDVEAAKAFFSATVGWTFDAMDMGEMTYWVAMQDGKPAGGIMQLRAGESQHDTAHWFSYLTVDDVDARIAKVEANGGTVVTPPFDVPNVGRIAIVVDSAGAPMGWITPAAG